MSGVQISSKVSGDLDALVTQMLAQIRQEMNHRAFLTANELRNASLDVLRGQGGGRRYRVPGTKKYYTASAPGQPPAVRTGAFRLSWQPKVEAAGDVYTSKIETNIKVGKKGYLLGELLEGGTSKMAPRLHHDRILQKAEPNIVKIYSKPFNI